LDKVKGGYVEGTTSIVINLVLFALKFWAGIVTGSLALEADAWHTLSDSISSVVLVIAAKLMSKKADKEHPFGHGRWEQVAALFIAFILGIIGYDFLKQSIIQFRNRDAVHFGTLAIAVTVASILVKEALAQYAFYIARKTGSTSIKADGWHHRSDALSSVVVLVGIFLADYLWWVDSVLAAVIALFLFYATYKIIKETVTKMLGEEPDKDLIERITADVKAAYHDNLQIHHFHLHDYVTEKELTLHIRLDKNMTIEKGHEIASEIEDTIKKNFGIMTTIHIEPLKMAVQG